jgi:hypothetical protein
MESDDDILHQFRANESEGPEKLDTAGLTNPPSFIQHWL